MESTLTQGKPYKQIIRFTLPLLIGNLFQQIYNMVDAFIVSRTLGVNAFAGVSSTAGIILLIIGSAQGLTVGLSILISHSFGAGEENNVRNNYTNNMIICVVSALLLTLLSLSINSWILEITQTPDDIWDYSYDYLQIMFVGIIGPMMFNFFSNTIRALGDSKTPLYYLLIASILNIILDYVLISYTPLGVRGAALATVLSQIVSAVLCAITIRKKFKIISIEHFHFKISSSTILKNLKIGLPMAFQSSIIALGVIIIQVATNTMGTTAVAAYAVGVKIDGIAVEPLRSFGMAMTTFTAQNYGARKYKRVIDSVKQCIFITISIAITLGLLMIFGGRHLSAIFVGVEQSEILSMSHSFLIIHGSLYIVLSLLFVFRYTLQGIGQTAIPTIAGVMELLMRFLAAVFLVDNYEFIGASFATPLSWIGAFIPVCIAYVFTLQKLKKSIKP
ncbi:MATE family efflux transporter [Metabacillus arenae]|uniref:MATE family efflux transporter n=1 Tax=Metabacillus arenae TaxID=2771434 RepID=A0A926S2F6_9BACI|nr:MATE family efflux transporter [Metabacillus arenae]MBD1381964.1 MATE family efflux transporter [Metabacillus arenae]